MIEYYEAYNSLYTSGESRICYSDFKAFFEIENITDNNEKREYIYWIRCFENTQSEIRNEEMKKKKK